MSQPAEHLRKTVERIESFEYPADPHAPPAPGWAEWEKGLAGDGGAGAGPAHAATQAFEQRLAEETRRAFEGGCERGRQEGRQAERTAQGAALQAAQERLLRQTAGLVENFAAERDRYLLAAEHEVVKLALAIAARILRREAQMDPLLLTGAARVALGQLSASTEVRLRVPAADLDLWTEAMALIPNLPLRPAVVGEDGLRLGDCVLETGLGTVDLGIRAQLAEIERGFFDRAGCAARPLFAEARAEGDLRP
jgi:flagellar assembly protein FliH